MSVQTSLFTHCWKERPAYNVSSSCGREDSGNNRFEVCCIPFFVRDLALGDVVTTSATEGLEYVVAKVVAPSGRYVFRVWFGESFHPRDEIASDLSALGSLIEWSSRNLLAIDAVDRDHAQRVADVLMELENVGHLIYETGRSK